MGVGGWQGARAPAANAREDRREEHPVGAPARPTPAPEPRRSAHSGRRAGGAARPLVLPFRRGCRLGAEPGGAGLLLDPGDRRGLVARPLDRRPARRGGGKRHGRPAGDLHPAVGGRADRHLGDERHAGRHGLLRAEAAQPRLFLPDRLPDLPGRGHVDRQLVDRRRHARNRPHGHCPARWVSTPAITAGAVISGAYFGDKLSPLSGTANLACAAAGADLYDHVRESLRTSGASLALALVLFWSLGLRRGVRRLRRDGPHRGRLPALARTFPPAGARARAGTPALAAVRRHLPRRTRRRRPRRRRTLRSGSPPSPMGICPPASPSSRASGRHSPAATSPPPASPPSTNCSRGAAWRACSAPSG